MSIGKYSIFIVLIWRLTCNILFFDVILQSVFKMKRLYILILLVTSCIAAVAQSMTQITGMVRDSITREPIPYVSISVPGTDLGVITTEHGGFTLNSRKNIAKLRVSAVGYVTQEVLMRVGQTVVIVDLAPSSVSLSEVVVKRGKEKYSKKNNPAVELAKKLIARRNQGDPLKNDFYSYHKYERMMYGFNDLEEAGGKNPLLRKFKFLEEYADTSTLSGTKVLPVSIKEKLSNEYYRKDPGSHKEYVIAQKSDGIDESFDQTSIKSFLDDVFREIDIFENDVTLLTNRFVSPLSSIGNTFYKYYLNDTLDVDGERCIELSFVPFNTESFGFLGRMYIPLNDTTLFVKRVSMNVPHNINLNYVERVHIIQDFEKSPNGSRMKTRDDIEVEFRIIKGSPGLFARRETLYNRHSFNEPMDVTLFDKQGEIIIDSDANKRDEQYWTDNRLREHKTDGNSVQRMLTRLRQSKAFYWGEKIISTFVNGYIPTASRNAKWEFGPVNTAVSGNSLEGVRLRVGGMSTVNLSRHWFTRVYAAYGCSDKVFKYSGQLEYSFNEKQSLDQEFPINSIRLKHQYDVDKLGQHYLYTNTDNVFLALKRQKDNKMLYLRNTELEYKYENLHHFSFAVAFEHNIHEDSKFLGFVYPDGTVRNRYTEAGFKVALRYAPGEKFYQTRNYRIPINMDAPIISVTHTYMPKGFMGSLFEINKTEVGLQKRFWFSAFGYTDIILKGAKLWSKASYPDLLLPNANLSYTIQPESYALMNAMEFVNDQYLSWDVTYWGNGILMNRLPLIKKLKLREVISMRGLWGSLSDKNNPAKSGDVFAFPSNALCQEMGRTPYMEMGVGLDNIFTILRVDYVWRLSYRHTPGVDRNGVRIQLHFTF